MVAWQYHPLIVAFFAGGLLSLVVAGYCVRYVRRYGWSYLAGGIGLLAFNNAIWVFAAGLKTASADLGTKLLFYKLQFLGAAVNPSVGIVIALAYVGWDRWITKRSLTALAVPPALFVPLIVLNPGDVMIVDAVLVDAQGIEALEHQFPPLFALYLAWVLGTATSAGVIIVYGTARESLPWKPSLAGAFTILLPVVFAALKVAGIYPPGGDGINVTPAVNGVAITLLAVAVFRYRIFELLPVGRDHAVELMDDGYLLVGRTGTVLDSNPTARSLLTDRSDQTLRNTPVRDLLPATDDLQPGERTRVSIRDRTVEVRLSTVTRQNQTAGRLFVLQDVTERERRRLELERYERIVQNVPVGVFRYVPEPSDELLFTNPKLLEVFGAGSATRLDGYSARDLYVDPDQYDAFDQRLLDEGEITGEEVQFQTVDGEQFWGSLSAARIVEDDREYVEGAIQDITNRKEYEQRLKRTRERAQSERDAKESVRQLLLASSSTPDIAESVCRLLVDSHGYTFATVVQPGDEGLLTLASHGDADDLMTEAVTRSVLDGNDVAVQTVEDGGDLATALAERDLHSVRAVTLEHDGITFGALTVVRADPDEYLSQDLVDEVAAAIAFKQQIEQQQRALIEDVVIELDVRISDGHPLPALSSALDGAKLDASEIQGGDDVSTLFVETTAVDTERLVSVAESRSAVSAGTPISDDEERAGVTLDIEPPTLGSVLSRYGGVLQSITAQDGRVDIVVELPRRTDIGEVVDALTEHWPDVELRSRRERTVERESLSAFESLTDKQEQALRTATLAGFFDRPQRANASDIAEILDVSRTTFLHHLRNAERKLFEAAFDEV